MIPPVAGDVVEVGQTYLVPCINGVPVVGTPHSDADHFNRTIEEHFHCDTRFHDDQHGAACAMRNRETTLEPRVCLRDTPLPFDENTLGMTLMSLYADYGFTELKCGLCPHKGMPVQNGRCTGHRLEWLPDGTIKYKPPYTLVIRGTDNTLRIDERQPNLTNIVFHIVYPVPGNPVRVDMHDRDGTRIATQRFDVGEMRIGDQLRIAPR